MTCSSRPRAPDVRDATLAQPADECFAATLIRTIEAIKRFNRFAEVRVDRCFRPRLSLRLTCSLPACSDVRVPSGRASDLKTVPICFSCRGALLPWRVFRDLSLRPDLLLAAHPRPLASRQAAAGDLLPGLIRERGGVLRFLCGRDCYIRLGFTRRR